MTDDLTDRADSVRALVAHRCPEIGPADLALITQPDEPLGEMIPVTVAGQILDVVMALDDRMTALEDAVRVGNATVDQVWRLMADLTVDQKIAMLERLEGLVAMEEATYSPIQ